MGYKRDCRGKRVQQAKADMKEAANCGGLFEIEISGGDDAASRNDVLGLDPIRNDDHDRRVPYGRDHVRGRL